MLIGLLHRLIRLRLRMLGFRTLWMDIPNCRVCLHSYHHPTAADTLILLHGVGTSSSTWLYLYPLLIQKYSVVAIDLPGFGFSRVVDRKGFLSLDEHVAAVERCREHLRLARSTLVGHSLGGWIALRCALQSPDRTNRLILINPAGVFTDGMESLRQLFAVQRTADVRSLMMRMWYRYPWYFKPFLPAIRKELIDRKVPELIGSIARKDFLNDRLQELSVPVHLIWGTEDRLLHGDTVQIFKQRVQQVKVEYIRACGHIPQLEKPRELAVLLRKILWVDEKEKPSAHQTTATALRP